MPLPPDPVAFQIPGLGREVYWYGIMVTLGTLAGAMIADREARRHGRNPDHVWNALIVVMVFGLLGARIYHVVSSPADGGSSLQGYLADPMSIIAFWRGGLRGLGIYGAIAGGVVGLWFYVWEFNHRLVTNALRALASPFVRALGRPHLQPIHTPADERLEFAQLADICAVGVPLGQAIGRWGNYFNQELYGMPTDRPWGIPVAPEYRLPRFADLPAEQRFHPSFLYESLWNLLAFAVLLLVSRRWRGRLRAGDVALLYVMLYALGRFLVEYQRPDAWTYGGVPVAQIVSVALIALAALLMLWRHGFHRRGSVVAEAPG